jgi:hypothetical protein
VELATINQIEAQLRRLPSDKLAVVLDFVSCLIHCDEDSGLLEALRASDTALRKDWDRPEEDAAWADL